MANAVFRDDSKDDGKSDGKIPVLGRVFQMKQRLTVTGNDQVSDHCAPGRSKAGAWLDVMSRQAVGSTKGRAFGAHELLEGWH